MKFSGPKTTFWTISQLNSNFNGLYLPKDTTIYIIGQVFWQLEGVCYVVSKCGELSSTNGLKLDRNFYPPSLNSVRSPVITHAVAGIDVAPHGECKWNGIGFVCSSDSMTQRDFNLAMASRRATLSGNASVIFVLIYFLVLVLVFQLFFSFSFVPVLSNLLTKTCWWSA